MHSTADLLHNKISSDHRFNLCLIILLVVICYLNSLTNGFTLDDEFVLLANTEIRSLDNASKFFTDTSTGTSNPGQYFYRPLRTLTYALVYSFSGYNPLHFHILNAVFHLFNALLAYALLTILTGRTAVALGATLIFATHPLATEAVSSITGLTDVLFTFFYLCAAICFLLWRKGKSIWFAGASTVLLLGALLSKEMAVSFPLLIIAMEYFYIRNQPDWPQPERFWLLVLSYFGLIGLIIGIRTYLLGTIGQHGEPPGGTFYFSLLMQIVAIGKYLWLFIIPTGQSVRHAIDIQTSLFTLPVLLSGISILALVAVMVRSGIALQRFALVWFFITLLPAMNLIAIRGDLMGERFLYLPLLGLAAILSSGVSYLATKFASKRFFLVTIVLITLSTSALTIKRNQVWESNITLFENAVSISPRSNLIRLSLAKAYAESGEQKKARDQIIAASENTRWYLNRYTQLSEDLYAKGQIDAARIFELKAEKIRMAIDPQ